MVAFYAAGPTTGGSSTSRGKVSAVPLVAAVVGVSLGAIVTFANGFESLIVP